MFRLAISLALVAMTIRATAADPTAQMSVPAVQQLLDLLNVRPGETLYDLGCGPGRILIKAAGRGAKPLGIELDPGIYEKCQRNVHLAGYSGRIQVLCGDATRYDLGKADIVTVYLFRDVRERIAWQTMKPGARVGSYQHPVAKLGQASGIHRIEIDGRIHTFYIYRIGK